jgi:2,5-diketo-D-gluconate reductase A
MGGAAPTTTLLHGAEMPRIGLGTWPMDDREAERAVAEALDVGYRLVDTAYAYGNEAGVGRGIRASGVPREEVFVTTKLNAGWHGADGAREAWEASARALRLDVIDLMLIHWPNPRLDRYAEAFAGLVRLVDEGRLRAAGVSNFKPAHVDRVVAATGVVPDVNQIELNPRTARAGPRAHDERLGILTESYSPIGKGGALLREPAVTAIAGARGRTPAQVVLRWHLELGCVPIPKSSDPGRMRENLDVFGFALTPDEVAALTALDRGEAAATDSDVYGH